MVFPELLQDLALVRGIKFREGLCDSFKVIFLGSATHISIMISNEAGQFRKLKYPLIIAIPA
jgi:hypothetical protein